MFLKFFYYNKNNFPKNNYVISIPNNSLHKNILLLLEKRLIEKLDINSFYRCVVRDIVLYIFYLHFSNTGFK